MASQVPPKRGTAFTYEICLVSQADTDIFQSNPTLAAGDVVVYKDGALDGNADNLPAAIGAGKLVAHTLSATEMTADRIDVVWSDAVGDEWQDAAVTIHTVTTSQIDDLATAAALATVDSNVDAILADTGTDGVVLADDAITAAKIAIDAITSDELAASATAEIAAAVWAYVTRTLTAGAATAAQVWSYATRTLTQSAASVTAAVSGSTVSITRGDTLSASITGLGDISGRTKLWFTVKVDRSDADSAAIIQIEETAGLVYLNGADASARAANGDITIDDATAGNVTITLTAGETKGLAVTTGLYYDIQMLATSTVTTLTAGTCNIVTDVTRAVS